MAQTKSTVWGARDGDHVDLGGSALLFGVNGDPFGEYRVRDLTSRGALLRGSAWDEHAGRRVHVMLALPSRAEPLAVWGDVDRFAEARPDAGDVDMELRFTGLSADDEDVIEDAILIEWSRLSDA